MTFGDEIKALRVALQLTQVEAAKLPDIEVAPRTWQNWEADTITPPATRQRHVLATLKAQQVPR